MQYIYNEDSYLLLTVDSTDLESMEEDSIKEVEKANISDPYYKEKLVKIGVYKRIAAARLEAEGEAMERKLKHYSKEYDRILKMAKTDNPVISGSVSTVKIYRG